MSTPRKIAMFLLGLFALLLFSPLILVFLIIDGIVQGVKWLIGRFRKDKKTVDKLP